MRIVVDTNVLISGAFFSGIPSLILDACVKGKLKLVLTPEILEEYQGVGEEFSRKRPNVVFEQFLGILIAKALIIESTQIESNICRDPDDQKFIECAVSGNSKYLVSGYKDLLDIDEYKNVEIYSPREFSDKFLE